jgi:hypothetical protein
LQKIQKGTLNTQKQRKTLLKVSKRVAGKTTLTVKNFKSSFFLFRFFEYKVALQEFPYLKFDASTNNSLIINVTELRALPTDLRQGRGGEVDKQFEIWWEKQSRMQKARSLLSFSRDYVDKICLTQIRRRQ